MTHESTLAARNADCSSFAPGDTSDAALDAFCAAVDALRADYFAAQGFTSPRGFVSFTRGQKFARIVLGSILENSSVFCFVDLANGNILKAASFKVPAKGARGNISNGAAQVGPYGAAYLR